MANPTLITGFEDVMTYIRQQDERIKRLEEQEKNLRKITCCADSEKLVDRVSEIVESKNKYFAEVENHEETIDKLQKEIKEYEFESCESVVTSQKVYGQAFAIQAERDKLKEENEKLKEKIHYLAGEMTEEVNNRFSEWCKEVKEVTEENKKLKEHLLCVKNRKDEEINKLQEQNKKLKDQLKCANELIIEAQREIVVSIKKQEVAAKVIKELQEENEKLQEENKKLEKEAKAWKIINHGADWQNLRDLCDEEMCKALIETGECDKEDFEGYSYEPQ